jgi:16S rRNA (cytidine1402-2'-O)-methyltransferase
MTDAPPPPGLSVVGTPLGNLADLSPRGAETLRGADLIACEDTRRTGTLVRHVGAGAPLVSLHAHNEQARIPEVLARIRGGARVALVTDAGMPSVSDPGARLVEAVHAEGLPVTLVPGPSAVTTALAGCGAPADRFVFAGFLPRKAGEREDLLGRLDALGHTVVAFEGPHRLAGTLRWLAGRRPDRYAAVCREMTKLHEEVAVGPVADLAERFAGDVRGEVTLVLWPAPPAPADDRLAETVRVLLAAGLSPARAADAAAALGAGARNAAYRAAIAADSLRDR